MGYGGHVTAAEYCRPRCSASRSTAPTSTCSSAPALGAAHADSRLRGLRARRRPTRRDRRRGDRSSLDRLGRLPLRRQPGRPAGLRGADRARRRPPARLRAAPGPARARRRGARGRRGRRALVGFDAARPPAIASIHPYSHEETCREHHRDHVHRAPAAARHLRDPAPSCGRTTRRSSSSRRPRSTCSASTAGCATSSTSRYFDSFAGGHPRVFVPSRPRASATSPRSRTSATTCSATTRCATGSPRMERAARSRS